MPSIAKSIGFEIVWRGDADYLFLPELTEEINNDNVLS